LVDYSSRLPWQYDRSFQINTVGTRNVVDACLAAHVRKLIYTSSSSVVLSADVLENPMHLADESRPYPTAPYVNHYVPTKMLAEQYVLEHADKKKDSENGLLTVAIRPGGLWGQRGVLWCGLYFQPPGSRVPLIGTRTSQIDFNYVGNVAHAEFCAERALTSSQSVANGSAYFITDRKDLKEPTRTYHDVNNGLAKTCGLGPGRYLPPTVIDVVARVSEWLQDITKGKINPLLGSLVELTPPVLVLSRGVWTVDDAKARKEIGYKPLYSWEESCQLFGNYFNEVKANAEKTKEGKKKA